MSHGPSVESLQRPQQAADSTSAVGVRGESEGVKMLPEEQRFCAERPSHVCKHGRNDIEALGWNCKMGAADSNPGMYCIILSVIAVSGPEPRTNITSYFTKLTNKTPLLSSIKVLQGLGMALPVCVLLYHILPEARPRNSCC